MSKLQPTKAAEYLDKVSAVWWETEPVTQSLAQALDDAGLRTAVENFSQCIDELESSGYCHDHPSLVKYRKALAALTGEHDDKG